MVRTDEQVAKAAHEALAVIRGRKCDCGADVCKPWDETSEEYRTSTVKMVASMRAETQKGRAIALIGSFVAQPGGMMMTPIPIAIASALTMDEGHAEKQRRETAAQN